MGCNFGHFGLLDRAHMVKRLVSTPAVSTLGLDVGASPHIGASGGVGAPTVLCGVGHGAAGAFVFCRVVTVGTRDGYMTVFLA